MGEATGSVSGCSGAWLAVKQSNKGDGGRKTPGGSGLVHPGRAGLGERAPPRGWMDELSGLCFRLFSGLFNGLAALVRCLLVL